MKSNLTNFPYLMPLRCVACGAAITDSLANSLRFPVFCTVCRERESQSELERRLQERDRRMRECGF